MADVDYMSWSLGIRICECGTEYDVFSYVDGGDPVDAGYSLYRKDTGEQLYHGDLCSECEQPLERTLELEPF